MVLKKTAISNYLKKTKHFWLFLILIYFWLNGSPSYDQSEHNYKLPVASTTTNYNDTINIYNLKTAKKYIDSVTKLENESIAFNDSRKYIGINSLGIGIRYMPKELKYFNSFSNPNYENQSKNYFGVTGLRIKPNRNFFSHGDSNYIKNENGNIFYTKYRYNTETHTLFVPLENNSKFYFKILNWIFSIFIFGGILIASIVAPLFVLKNMLKTRKFTKINYKYLTWSMYYSFIIAILSVAISTISYFIVVRNLGNHFEFNFTAVFKNFGSLFSIGLLTYIIKEVFVLGSELQKEKELTI